MGHEVKTAAGVKYMVTPSHKNIDTTCESSQRFAETTCIHFLPGLNETKLPGL
ncbi:MAG: hypothetical protein JXJ04_21475 [Spirochaetales bacterium]|nr:hypothetical protein [Spirochaetales bacterium]